MADASFHSATIYRTQPTSTGHLGYVSTGCAWIDENVATAKSTAATTFKNHGLSVVGTTIPNLVAAPQKGIIKDVLFYGTTKAMKLKASTGVTINNATDTVVTVTLGTTKLKEIGCPMRLVGMSTSKWWLLMSPSTSVTVTLASAT